MSKLHKLFLTVTAGALMYGASQPAYAQDVNPVTENLIISEICYNPYGTDNLSESEWCELYNRGATTLDLSGYSFKSTAGSNPPVYTFATGTQIAPGDYLVLAPVKRNILGVLQQRLDPDKVIDLAWPLNASHFTNGSGKLQVFDTDGVTTVAEVNFKTSAPWPGGSGPDTPNSTGRSIELDLFDLPAGDPSAYMNDGSNWTTSDGIYGSPGRANSAGNTNGLTITGGNRAKEFPTSSDSITITGDVTTSAGSVTSASIFVNTTGGSAYTTTALTLDGSGNFTFNLGTLPSGTMVKYYIQATDNRGFVKTWPIMPPQVFFVDDNPVSTGDVIINEILFNPAGGDNSTNSEFVEIYNNRATPVNLSYFQWGRYVYLPSGVPDPYLSAIPEGTILPGNGYLVLAADKDLFLSTHPGFDTNLVVGSGWLQSALANGGAPVDQPVPLVNVNAAEWGGSPTVPFETVAYEVGTDGWPGGGTDTTADADGESIELLSPTLDRNVGSNWRVAVAPNFESPGAPNTVSEVSDWTMY